MSNPNKPPARERRSATTNIVLVVMSLLLGVVFVVVLIDSSVALEVRIAAVFYAALGWLAILAGVVYFWRMVSSGPKE